MRATKIRPPAEAEADRQRSVASRSAGVLGLQKLAGNRATGRMLQRYTVQHNYVLGAVAAGTELFRSQALDAANARYERKRITSGAGGLSEHHEYYDQAANAWQAAGAGPVAVAQPAMRFSAAELFAVPNSGGQSQVAWVAPAEIAAANVRLAGQNATVRLQELSGQLTTAAGTPMRQATGVLDTAHQAAAQPALGTIARNDQKWFNSMCHVFATYSSPTAIGTGPGEPGTKKDRKALPEPGRKYYFKGPTETVIEMTPHDFDTALNKLATIDGLLAQVGLARGVGDVVQQQGIGGLGKYRGLLPGWADHSEGVICRDGPDTLTFANYNRQMEMVGIVGVRIRELARANGAFKTALLNLRTAQAANLPQTNKAFTNTDINRMMASGAVRPLLLNAIGVYDNNLQTILTDLVAAKSAIQGELFYFDMFGPKQQSFHKRYQYAGGRGKSGKTIVIGTPS